MHVSLRLRPGGIPVLLFDPQLHRRHRNDEAVPDQCDRSLYVDHHLKDAGPTQPQKEVPQQWQGRMGTRWRWLAGQNEIRSCSRSRSAFERSPSRYSPARGTRPPTRTAR